MTIIFENIQWADSQSANMFNAHALQSIILSTDGHGAHINCATKHFDLPFVNYRYGGGVAHHEFKVLDPYTVNGCFNIRIFDNGKVSVIDFSRNADKFFNQRQIQSMNW